MGQRYSRRAKCVPCFIPLTDMIPGVSLKAALEDPEQHWISEDFKHHGVSHVVLSPARPEQHNMRRPLHWNTRTAGQKSRLLSIIWETLPKYYNLEGFLNILKEFQYFSIPISYQIHRELSPMTFLKCIISFPRCIFQKTYFFDLHMEHLVKPLRISSWSFCQWEIFGDFKAGKQ